MDRIDISSPAGTFSSPQRDLAIRRRLWISGLVLWVLAAGGCAADGGDSPQPLATIDTLPGGAVRVHNSAVGLWDSEPDRRWRLVEEVRIGRADGSGPDVFGAIGSIVEDPLGRAWVVDQMASEIRVFDVGGAHVRTIGRRGSGPGEFERAAVALLGPDGNMWVDDAMLRRWEVFDTAGVRVAGYPGGSNLGGGVRAWTSDSLLLEVNSHPIPGGDIFDRRTNLSVRRLTADGSLVAEDSLEWPEFSRGPTVRFQSGGDRPYTILQRLPLAHHPQSLLTLEGEFWASAGGGAYAIRRQSATGDTLLIIEREYAPIAASPRAMEAAAEALLPPEGMTSSDNDTGRLPDVHPPFEDYFPAADRTLWVRRVFAPDSVGFDVFDSSGQYLGRPESTVDVTDLRIAYITRDRIYAVARDEMDVQSVLVLRIERP